MLAVCCVPSSAQLLEPFRHSHIIQLISGGTKIISGSTAVGDFDRAPGATIAGMMQSDLSVATTTDIEYPPGLYEKVEQQYYNLNHKCYLSYFHIRLSAYCLSGCIVSTNLACSKRVTKYMLHMSPV